MANKQKTKESNTAPQIEAAESDAQTGPVLTSEPAGGPDETFAPTPSDDTPTDGTETVAPTLSLVDIKNSVAIMDFAAEQGAFKGWNVIQQVLNTRNKLYAFVNSVTPPEAKDGATADESTSSDNADGGTSPVVASADAVDTAAAVDVAVGEKSV